jgi:hypothetical protein
MSDVYLDPRRHRGEYGTFDVVISNIAVHNIPSTA